MASNDSGLADEDGDFSDWIEIHNPDATVLDLEGYSLTDDATKLTRWEFPAVSLEAGAYLVVFASNKNRSDPSDQLHTNFKLSAAGGYLALSGPDGIVSEFGPVYSTQFEDQSYGVGTFGSVTQETLVEAGDAVNYLIPEDGVLGTTWTAEAFDDATWATGTSGIGFEASGDLVPFIATNIDADMRGVNSTGYFRFPFSYSSAGKQLQSLQLTAIIDDGFVAYLNGVEIASLYAPASPAWNSGSIDSDSDTFVLNNPSTHTIVATPGMLIDGDNVLAIHGMNRGAGGSDFLLVPELRAEVMDVTGTQRVGFFDSPTPGSPNSGGQAAGSVFIEVTDKPARPVAGTDLVITAKMGAVASPVETVSMFYRVMFDAEKSVAMADDGVAPDAAAGDGIYTAAIPGEAFVAGEMIRWRFVAEDELGLETRLPAFREELDSHEYVGTVAINPAVETVLPTVETFFPNPGGANGTGGTRGAVFYLGELYDNIFMNRHGQSTGGFPKKSYNLDFNKSQRFRWHPNEKRVKDIDLLTNWADKSKARHVLSWEIMRESGVHAHFAFTVRVEQNGQFFSVADFVEDADDIYLERAGLNPEGALYKIYNNTLSSGDSTASPAVEKKNRREENNQDLSEFIAGLAVNGEAQWDFIYDNVNLPMMVNMAAANCVVRNTDMHRKNWYFYRDSGRSDEWATLPWDLDLAHGRKWNGSDNYFDTNLFSTEVIRVGTAVRLINAMWARADTREMMLRRISTLNDRFLNQTDTPYDQRYFERRLDEMLATVDTPMFAKSDAQLDFEKWGSWIHSNGGNSVPYTTNNVDVESMVEAVDRWKNEYLPGRRSHMEARSDIPDSQTGQIPFTYLTLVNPGDVVRVKVPIDGSEDSIWTGSDFDDAGWAVSQTGIGFDSSDYLPLIGYNTSADMRGKSASAYMRIDFEVADPNVYDALQLHMKYDDGYVAYLNGVKIHERLAPATPAWDSTATGSHESDVVEYEVFDVSASLGELVAGSNVLAIHGLNQTLGSSDFVIMPELRAGVADSNGSVQPLIEFGALEFNPDSGNQDEEYVELINNNDIAVDISDWALTGGVEYKFGGGTVIPANSSLYLSPNVKTFRARAASPKGGEQRFVIGGYNGHLSSFGESLELLDSVGALNSSTSYLGDPSDVQNFLVITEIMYHPEPDGAAEFIELMNISDSITLDLTGVNFTQGITFDFTGSDVTSLAPGARLVVVKNVAAFEAAYAAGLTVAGVFDLDSSLSNGGESIKVEDAEGGTIKEFTYSDTAPWPTSPDTDGYSLVLIAPDTNPDPSDPSNWRASVTIGGSPDGSDDVTFTGDPVADNDGDGLSALVEYALGSSDSDPASGAGAISTGSVEIGGSDYATFTYRSNPAVGDVDLTIETTLDLITWIDTSDDLVELESITNADGTVTKTLRQNTPIEGGSQRYYRLRVALR